MWNKYPCCVSDIPAFWLDTKNLKLKAKDYDKVKIALIKRYALTEDGYRRKFRASKPEVDESPEQFIVRLDRYLLRWLELSDTAQTFDGLKDLIVKEQFIDSCPKDLAVHLREGHLKLWQRLQRSLTSIWRLMVNICLAQWVES